MFTLTLLNFMKLVNILSCLTSDNTGTDTNVHFYITFGAGSFTDRSVLGQFY